MKYKIDNRILIILKGRYVMKNKIYNFFSNKLVFKEIKFWLTALSLFIYGYISQIMMTKPMIQYILVLAGLLIFDMIMYRLLDELYIFIVLKEVLKNNDQIQSNTTKLAKDFKSMIQCQQEINKTAIKYEMCWKSLKSACENSENTDLLESLDKIERIVDEDVLKELNNKIKEDI